tara:strand:- start:1970 stop:2134 length:165 start_codon:yes stop_codon:yes gene_type:complete
MDKKTVSDIGLTQLLPPKNKISIKKSEYMDTFFDTKSEWYIKYFNSKDLKKNKK